MNPIIRLVEINRLLRSIGAKCRDGVDWIAYEGIDAALPILGYIKSDYQALKRLWPDTESPDLSQLGELVSKNEGKGLQKAIDKVLPVLEQEVDHFLTNFSYGASVHGIEDLLHPAVIRSSYKQFCEGLYRDAVLNAVVAVFDLLRERTGLDDDGSQLVTKTFSLNNPILVLSTLKTESGKNEQKGFIQILQGAFIGIRNPKAHSLYTDLTQDRAAQYLVFASLLARRVDEARLAKYENSDVESEQE